MKKLILFSSLFSALLFIFPSVIFAQAVPHAEYNDCNNDIISAVFTKKTRTIDVVIATTTPEANREQFKTLHLDWRYYPTEKPTGDTIFGWVRNHYHERNGSGNAWVNVRWHDENAQLFANAGITVTIGSIIKNPSKDGKIHYQIILTKEQVEYLKMAKALTGMDIPRLWFKG